MDGTSIRSFFRALFGSRAAEILELELIRLRSDFESRMRYQDDIIATLREDKAALQGKVSLYEQSLLPLASRAGADVVRTATKPTHPSFPKFDFSETPPVKSRWAAVQEQHEKDLAAEEAAEQEAKR